MKHVLIDWNENTDQMLYLIRLIMHIKNNTNDMSITCFLSDEQIRIVEENFSTENKNVNFEKRSNISTSHLNTYSWEKILWISIHGMRDSLFKVMEYRCKNIVEVSKKQYVKSSYFIYDDGHSSFSDVMNKVNDQVGRKKASVAGIKSYVLPSPTASRIINSEVDINNKILILDVSRFDENPAQSFVLHRVIKHLFSVTDFLLILVGSDNNLSFVNITHPFVLNYINKLKLADILQLVFKCDFFVGENSLQSSLSHLLNKPTLNLGVAASWKAYRYAIPSHYGGVLNWKQMIIKKPEVKQYVDDFYEHFCDLLYKYSLNIKISRDRHNQNHFYFDNPTLIVVKNAQSCSSKIDNISITMFDWVVIDSWSIKTWIQFYNRISLNKIKIVLGDVPTMIEILTKLLLWVTNAKHNVSFFLVAFPDNILFKVWVKSCMFHHKLKKVV